MVKKTKGKTARFWLVVNQDEQPISDAYSRVHIFWDEKSAKYFLNLPLHKENLKKYKIKRFLRRATILWEK